MMTKTRKYLSMNTANTAKYLLLTAGFCVIGLSAQAQQDRDLTQAEINQLYDDLLLKEISLIDTDDIELEDKQRKEIAQQIVYHYTEAAQIKGTYKILTEKDDILPFVNIQMDRGLFENALKEEKKIKNMEAQYDIKNIEYMGQKAIVDVNIIHTYKYDATEIEDIIKVTADVITKNECRHHIVIDYDDIPRISHENCKGKAMVTNIEETVPDYIKDAQGSGHVQFGSNVLFQ